MKTLENGAEVIQRIGGYILCLFNGQYVTWACKEGDHPYWGHYFENDLVAAAKDLQDRAGTGEEKDPDEGKEIYKTLVLSTGHITEHIATNRFDTQEDSSYFNSTEYGYRLYCGFDEFPESRNGDQGKMFSNWTGLRSVWRKAKESGCRWVEFDGDGPEIEGLARYEW